MKIVRIAQDYHVPPRRDLGFPELARCSPMGFPMGLRLSMNLAVTIGTRLEALIHFFLHFLPTPSITLRGNTELFPGRIVMVKFKCIDTAIIATLAAFPAFILDGR